MNVERVMQTVVRSKWLVSTVQFDSSIRPSRVMETVVFRVWSETELIEPPIGKGGGIAYHLWAVNALACGGEEEFSKGFTEES